MTQRYFATLVLLLAWLPAAAFAQTISSFSPTSGNAGTLVTLRGTDLNLVTAVAVNGTSCVILDKTNSTLHLLVMPAATSGPVTTTGGAPAASATAFAVTRPAVNPAQQGAKLVGTAAVGRANQGWSMALSADGNTLAAGGKLDNNHAGATWVFVRSGTSWGQQGPKLVGTGAVGNANQGTSVALSADGSTLAVGGSWDLRTEGGSWVLRTGATWVFSTASSPLAQRAAAGPRATTSFFPNPVAEQLTVTSGARTGTWRLLDSTGRTRLAGAYHAGQPLDLSALPAGLYWLQVDQAPARPLLKR